MWHAHISHISKNHGKRATLSVYLRADSPFNPLSSLSAPSLLHKYKHMENVRNVSKLGRASRILPVEVPPNGANWSKTAIEAKCNLEVGADPAALVS